MSAETVTVRDASSGRVHRRYRTETGRLASLEECNADASGAFSVLTDAEVAAAKADDKCRHCFPSVTYTTTYTTEAESVTGDPVG